MSDLAKTIEIIFQGKDNLSGSLDKMSRNLKSFEGSLDNIGGPLDAAATSILKVDAALAAFAAGGITLALAKSIEFENATVEMKKVLGDGIGLETATQEATRLSEVYGESASSILLNAANFKQAGYDISDSLLLTKSSMDLVIAGNIEGSEASNLIVAALKGFGEEATEAARFVDILNEVSNNYATDVQQLANGMATLSPIAKQMGFSMEETAGILTPVIEIFRSGEEAATALKTGLLRITDNSKPVQEALSALGISQADVNGAMKSGKEIYMEVATAFQGLSKEEKLYYTQQLVGINQAAKMVVVFDEMALSTEITATAMDSAGSSAKEVAARLESAEIAVKQFKTSFDNLARTVGDQFKAASVEAIQGGTSIEQAIRDMIDAGTFDPIFDALRNFATDIGAFLEKIADDLPEAFVDIDFDELLEAFGAINDAVGGMFDGFDLSTSEGLRGAIKFVVDSLESLLNVSAGVAESLGIISGAITSMMRGFNELPPDLQELIGNVLGLGTALTTLAGIVAVGSTLMSGLSSFAGLIGAGGAISAGVSGLVTLLSGPVGLAIALGAASVALVDFIAEANKSSIEDQMDKNIAAIEKTSEAAVAMYQQIMDLPADVNTLEITTLVDKGELEEAQRLIDEITKEERTSKVKAEVEQKEFEDYWDKLATLPEEKKTEVLALINAGKFDELEEYFKAIEQEKKVPITPDLNAEKTRKALDEIAAFEKEVKATVGVETTGVKEAKAEIDTLPESRKMEIQLQGDIKTEIARIKAEADALDAEFRYKATVDVAEIEAAADITKQAFESVNQTMQITADSTVGILEALLENIEKLNETDKSKVFEMIEEQIRMQQEALEMEAKLVDAQIKYMETKSDAIKSGEGLIQITSDGLEPALEKIMWEILKKVQLRVNEESAEFLLGLQ